MRVFIISPLQGNHHDINVQYAMACMKDCLDAGEAPFAGHLLYPMVLDDDEPGDRQVGILAGTDWMAVANLVAVYMDMGVSAGMQDDISTAKELNIPIVYRTLPDDILVDIHGI